MIKAPRHDGDWPDRALECEEAMEDAFIAVADRLQAGGMSPEQAADELIEAAANPNHPFAYELRQIAASATHTGWRKVEVGNGIVSLAENYGGVWMLYERLNGLSGGHRGSRISHDQ